MNSNESIAGSIDEEHAKEGHNDLVGQPHEAAMEGPVAEAEAVAAQISTDEQPMGTLGRRFNRKSPFFIGMTAAAGVAVTYASIQLLLLAGNVMILIGLALFFGRRDGTGRLLAREAPVAAVGRRRPDAAAHRRNTGWILRHRHSGAAGAGSRIDQECP